MGLDFSTGCSYPRVLNRICKVSILSNPVSFQRDGMVCIHEMIRLLSKPSNLLWLFYLFRFFFFQKD
jgi:hypothetical protein